MLQGVRDALVDDLVEGHPGGLAELHDALKQVGFHANRAVDGGDSLVFLVDTEIVHTFTPFHKGFAVIVISFATCYNVRKCNRFL